MYVDLEISTDFRWNNQYEDIIQMSCGGEQSKSTEGFYIY